MSNSIDLSNYGITDVREIVYNPSHDQLFEEETREDLEGFEKGRVTESGAVEARAGIFTGRSPKDKFIVYDDLSKENLWWTSEQSPNDNKPVTPRAWQELKNLVTHRLSGKRLFVVDTFCGANRKVRMQVRHVFATTRRCLARRPGRTHRSFEHSAYKH